MSGSANSDELTAGVTPSGDSLSSRGLSSRGHSSRGHSGQGLSGHGLAALRGERLIFSDVGFALAPGELLKLTGRNGAGKSTLMRIIAGLVQPFAGTLAWNGRPVTEDRDAFRAEMLYSGHLDGLKTALTATENLTAFARLRPPSAHAPRPPMDPAAALSAFGIGELSDLPVRYMSAGQRRRVALARLLVAPAPLWLLDEPLTALDVGAIARLGEAVDAHRAGGGLVIAATHADLPGQPGRVLEIVPPEPGQGWDDDAFDEPDADGAVDDGWAADAGQRS